DGDAAPVERLEARRRVRHALARQGGDQPREEDDPDPPGPGASVSVRPTEEPRADNDVRLVPVDHLEQPRELGGIVLTVAVEADGELVAVLQRELEAGLNGRPNAEVEGQPDDERTRREGSLSGPVGRAVVEHDDVEPRVEDA